MVGSLITTTVRLYFDYFLKILTFSPSFQTVLCSYEYGVVNNLSYSGETIVFVRNPIGRDCNSVGDVHQFALLEVCTLFVFILIVRVALLFRNPQFLLKPC